MGELDVTRAAAKPSLGVACKNTTSVTQDVLA